MLRYVPWLAIFVSSAFALASPEGGRPRRFDSFGPRDNLRRLARGKSSNVPDFNGGDVMRSLIIGRGLDPFSGRDLMVILDPLTGGRLAATLDTPQLLEALDNFRGDEAFAVLDRLTGGELLGVLEPVDGTEVLDALEKARQARESSRHRISTPKRTLDTLSGMAFGASKRRDRGMSSLSKRNFDEIDNVGFTGFAKKSGMYGPYGRGRALALAKKNFDEIDRAGFGTYNKREVHESEEQHPKKE